MKSWIALSRLPTSHPIYRRLVKGNPLLHISLQSDHLRKFSYSKGYSDISRFTGLSISAVKRQIEGLVKDGVITRNTKREGDRFRTELFLNTDHDLFENLVQTEPQPVLQPEPQAEPQDHSDTNTSEAYTEPQTEPQTVQFSTIIQYLHTFSIDNGINPELISQAIDLARYWATQWNERAGKKKRLNKGNAQKFLIQLAENRDPDKLRQLCDFLPEEWKRWKFEGDQYAFRSEDISAFRDSDRFLKRIRKMESQPKHDEPETEEEKPEIVKKIESDPFYQPTQAELIEYQRHTRS